VLEIFAFSHDSVRLDTRCLGVKDRDVLAPVNDEGLSDQKQHNRDLSDRKEAPDGSLLLQVGGNQRRQDGAKQKQEASLENHAFLFIQREERRKHQERVDTSTLHVVTGVSHRHRPTKVNHGLGLECAQGVTSEPLSGLVVGGIHGVQGGVKREEIANE